MVGQLDHVQRDAPYDTLIYGGRVIDPANSIDGLYDVAITEGRIERVVEAGLLNHAHAKRTFDAEGMLVVPGLVDLHAHGYQFVEPIGIDFDRQCLSRCTTTVVDAGSSGASTFPGFRKFIV